MEKRLDEKIHPLSPRWTGRLSLHHLYERHDHRARQSGVDVIDDPRILLVICFFL